MIRIVTSFTNLIGIDLPIVQAPIGEAATPELAAAVSNAGGLGMLSLTWKSPDQARAAIRRTRELTDRPIAINHVLDWDPADNIDIALSEKIPLISFFWGDPGPYIDAIHRAGALVALTVGSAPEAKRAIEQGVDVLVAQGWEAGGHVWGNVASLPLIPAVVDVAAGRPVIAAGGIVDGRGMAAALTLGAAGIWMGTRFVLSQEASTHDLYRQRLIKANGDDTLHSQLFDGGWPNASLRAIRNSTTETWLTAGSPEPGIRPGEGEVVGQNQLGEPVLRYSSDSPTRGSSGDIEAMVMYAGQGVGILDAVLPAAEIVRTVAAEAAAALARAQSRFAGN